MVVLPGSIAVAGVSAACVVAGTMVACGAGRYPQHRVVIETAAGLMLVSGFGLLGYGLACALGQP